MAKYRYIETGEEFENELDALDFYCSEFSSYDCKNCMLMKHYDRNKKCNENMFSEHYQECGFELIDSVPKSRLAGILGVEECQEWIIDDNKNVIYRIVDGVRQKRLPHYANGKWFNCGNENELTALIKDPSKIHIIFTTPTIPEWTEREIEIARSWKTLNPDMKQFEITMKSSNAPEEFEIDGVLLSNLNNDCPNFTAQDFLEVKVCDILGDEV